MLKKILFVFLLVLWTNSFSNPNFVKKTKQGYLGVVIENIVNKIRTNDKTITTSQIIVKEVVENSPAEKCGLKENDIIVKINGEKIDDVEKFTEKIREFKPNTKISLIVLRDDKTKTFTPTLSEFEGEKSISIEIDHEENHEEDDDDEKKIVIIKKRMNEFSDECCSCGMKFRKLGPQLAEYFGVKEGLLVVEVENESDAQKSGFKAGDVIVKANGERVNNFDDIIEVVSENEDDKEISFEVMRKEKTISLLVKIDKEKLCKDNCEVMGFEKPGFDFPHKRMLKKIHPFLNNMKTNIEKKINGDEIEIKIEVEDDDDEDDENEKED